MRKWLVILLSVMLSWALFAKESVVAYPEMIVINEVASAGIFDFIELHNVTSSMIIFDNDLWSLIDDKEGIADGDLPVVIPRGTTISEYGYLLIAPYKVQVLDARVPKGIPKDALAVKSFALGSVDSVTLLYDRHIVDAIAWKTSINTLGRDPEDSARFTDQLVPTPGTVNVKDTMYTGSLPIVINEVCSKGLDYIELYNEADTPYTFEDGLWTLHDIGRKDKFTIPGGITIASHGFITIYPDFIRLPLSAGKNSYAATSGNRFGLGGKDSVFLRYRGAVVDRIQWLDHVASLGRFPDGSDNWDIQLRLTPGRANRN